MPEEETTVQLEDLTLHEFVMLKLGRIRAVSGDISDATIQGVLIEASQVVGLADATLSKGMARKDRRHAIIKGINAGFDNAKTLPEACCSIAHHEKRSLKRPMVTRCGGVIVGPCETTDARSALQAAEDMTHKEALLDARHAAELKLRDDLICDLKARIVYDSHTDAKEPMREVPEEPKKNVQCGQG